MSNPVKIFIAYARKDGLLLDELRVHLAPLERSERVLLWYDGKIEPGTVWEQAIKDNLHKADIILLLVSASAIASDYFYDKEMRDALDRHENGTAKVVPLILRPCTWQATPLGRLQALPKDGKAVTSWSDKDEAYNDAVNQIFEMVKVFDEHKHNNNHQKAETTLNDKLITNTNKQNETTSKVVFSDFNESKISKSNKVSAKKTSLALVFFFLGVFALIAIIYFNKEFLLNNSPVANQTQNFKEIANLSGQNSSKTEDQIPTVKPNIEDQVPTATPNTNTEKKGTTSQSLTTNSEEPGLKLVGLGERAPNIQLLNPNGQEMSLADLKGQVVLLDFWASWCRPCRKEHLNLVRAYDKYNSKGFTVFSVSLDEDSGDGHGKEKWEKAISVDNLKWKYHVSDLKGWKSSASSLYNVKSIPRNFLIDTHGRIVAKNLRGNALENKLAELLGEG